MCNANYPLNVFIDSNIFITNNFDFNKGQLYLLSKYIKEGYIKGYISDVVYYEVLKHFRYDCQESNESLRRIVNKRNVIYSESINVPSRDEIDRRCKDIFDLYLKNNEFKIINCDGIEIKPVLNKYTGCILPFENNQKKKNEFPDAIIMEEIIKEFKNDNNYIVISNDDGLYQAFQDLSIESYHDLKSLYDMINKNNEKYDKIEQFVNNKITDIKIELEDYIRDNEYKCIELDGLDTDRKGMSHGYDYHEVLLDDIEITDASFFSIDDIDEEYALVSLDVFAKFTFDCTYLDESDSIYDSEMKGYLLKVNRTNEEKHECNFPCLIKVKGDSFEIIDAIIDLDESTRTLRNENVSSYENISKDE